MRTRTIARGVAVAAATIAAALCGAPAQGAPGPQTAELGGGGTVRGDISMEPGDEDVVGIDLDEHARLDVSLQSDFSATTRLTGPDGTTRFTFVPGYSKILTNFRVKDAGRYHIRIASSDGTQGAYTLRAVEHWPTKVISGTFTDPSMTLRVPEGGSVAATFAAKPAKSWDPQIASLVAPDQSQVLAAPVAGAKGTVRLPKTVVAAAGDYVLAVGGGLPGAKYHATVTVKGPKVPTKSVDVRNGLTPVPTVSFAQDGVGAIFYYNCSFCHGWAGSYAGVAPRARTSFAYIRSGAMPRGLPHLKPVGVALIQAWISTGMNP